MHDDIVARLRRRHDDLNCLVDAHGIKSPAVKASELEQAMKDCWEAADEIERLRSAYRSARDRALSAEALLRESRERIPDWETGVNSDLLDRIDAMLAELKEERSAE